MGFRHGLFELYTKTIQKFIVVFVFDHIFPSSHPTKWDTIECKVATWCGLGVNHPLRLLGYVSLDVGLEGPMIDVQHLVVHFGKCTIR